MLLRRPKSAFEATLFWNIKKKKIKHLTLLTSGFCLSLRWIEVLTKGEQLMPASLDKSKNR